MVFLLSRLSPVRKLQLKEAEDNRKAANKCLQKTLTRWNPNYFSAAPLFEKVGRTKKNESRNGSLNVYRV